MTGDIYIFFFFGNGLIDDVIVIGWTDSDFKISRALIHIYMSRNDKGTAGVRVFVAEDWLEKILRCRESPTQSS